MKMQDVLKLVPRDMNSIYVPCVVFRELVRSKRSLVGKLKVA
jgi:hypothetical protein